MEVVKGVSATKVILERQDQSDQVIEEKYSSSESEVDVEENDESDVTEDEPANNPLDNKPGEYNQGVEKYVPRSDLACKQVVDVVKQPIIMKFKLNVNRRLQPTSPYRQDNAGKICEGGNLGESEETEAAGGNDSNIDSDNGSKENNEAQGKGLEHQPYSGDRKEDENDQEVEPFVPHILTVCKNFTDTLKLFASTRAQIYSKIRKLYVDRDQAASETTAAKEKLTQAQVEMERAKEKYEKYVASEEEVNKRLRSSVKEYHKYERTKKAAFHHLAQSKLPSLFILNGEDANIKPIDNKQLIIPSN